MREGLALEAADAVIAVSRGSREDIFRAYPDIDPARVSVIYNGIDTEEYAPDPGTEVLEKHGVDPDRPSVVFVGRITRQKGVPYLLEAALQFDPSPRSSCCARARPTRRRSARRSASRVERLRTERGNVIWIEQMLPKREVIQLLSHATVFACPSIYEPLGIVNLEAMACEAAVVATATGGIVEVVVDGETGLLVPFETAEGDITPRDPAAFVDGIAARVNELVADPDRAAAMGRAGRERAVRELRLVGDRTPDLRAVRRSGPLSGSVGPVRQDSRPTTSRGRLTWSQRASCRRCSTRRSRR